VVARVAFASALGGARTGTFSCADNAGSFHEGTFDWPHTNPPCVACGVLYVLVGVDRVPMGRGSGATRGVEPIRRKLRDSELLKLFLAGRKSK
jgi:hypothetical protein